MQYVSKELLLLLLLLFITFTQGIYNYVPETNQLQFIAQLMLLSLSDVLYFYISTSQRRRAAPNRAVFWSY